MKKLVFLALSIAIIAWSVISANVGKDAITYEPIVFMYHLILDEPYTSETSLFVSPSDFADHLDALNERGYKYIFADEYKSAARKTVALTFDDGYEDNYTEMFPILKEKGGKATVFLIADRIGTSGYLNKEQIKEMSDSGLVSFQSHTVSHPHLSELTEEQIRAEFQGSVEAIEAITGKPVKALAYPYGDISAKVTKIADQFFEFAYTTRSRSVASPIDAMRLPRYAILRGDGKNRIINILDQQ